MIDLHSHFLYNVDDGSWDIDTTIEMLHQAEEAGITHLLATPHVDEQTDDSKIKQIQAVFSEILEIIKKEKLNVKIKLAAELGYDTKLLTYTEQSWILIGQQIKYVLFELPMFNLPLNIADILFQLRLKKIIPIIAHPERNIKIQENSSLLINWIHQDCLVQINAGSVLGQFGKECQRLTEALLASRAVHFVGSDAHDPEHRSYKIFIEAHQYISNKYGTEYSNILFYENPEKIWYGNNVLNMNVMSGEKNHKNIQKIFEKLKIFRLFNR